MKHSDRRPRLSYPLQPARQNNMSGPTRSKSPTPFTASHGDDADVPHYMRSTVSTNNHSVNTGEQS